MKDLVFEDIHLICDYKFNLWSDYWPW